VALQASLLPIPKLFHHVFVIHRVIYRTRSRQSDGFSVCTGSMNLKGNYLLGIHYEMSSLLRALLCSVSETIHTETHIATFFHVGFQINKGHQWRKAKFISGESFSLQNKQCGRILNSVTNNKKFHIILCTTCVEEKQTPGLRKADWNASHISSDFNFRNFLAW
jgi:hypothetical protein